MQHLGSRVLVLLIHLHRLQLGLGNLTSSTILPENAESREGGLPAHYTVDRETNFDNLQKMSIIYNDCLEEKRFCYFFDHEKGCLHREMCHYLVAIKAEDDDFDQLHFDMINHARDLPSVIKNVRPAGWAAFAFSENRLMGGDLVFICAYYGGASHIHVSINVAKGNIYYDEAPYQDYLKNKVVIVGKMDSEIESRVMCSFDLNQTEDVIIDENPFSKSTFKFNLKENEYYGLMAIGQKMSKTWNISYHTVKEPNKKKFSKEQYDRIVNGISSGSGCLEINMFLVACTGILRLLMKNEFLN